MFASIKVQEVVVQKSYTEDEIYTDVFVTVIDRKDAASVLDLFSEAIPLQNYGLGHLKRIQPVDKANKASPLCLVVCPVSRFDDVDERVKDLCGSRRQVRVCKLAPENRTEFESWNHCWPLNFHASQLEKDREKGLSDVERNQIFACVHALTRDESSRGGSGGVIVNPDCGLVVATTTEAAELVRSRSAENSSEGSTELFDKLYTPTMLCIEGVAAVVRGDMPGKAASLLPNAYLCSGLDLYLTQEPDLMSAMALVHSRIRRVFFRHADPEKGALMSGRGHIHCLRALNHRYRAFQILDIAATAGEGGDRITGDNS